MPMNLNSPKVKNETIAKYNISSFSVDIDRQEIHVMYTELNTSDQVLNKKLISIVEPNYTAAIIAASTEAGYNIYTALKNSLYAQIQAQTGDAGTVV